MVFVLYCHRQGIHFAVYELQIPVSCHRQGVTFVDRFGMLATLVFIPPDH